MFSERGMNYKKLIGAGLVSVGFVLFSILVWPLYESLVETRAMVEKKQAILDDKKGIFDQISNLKNKINSNKTSIDQLTSILPATKKPQEIVVSVEEATREAGVELTDFKTAELTSSNKTTDYQTIQVELGGFGSYQSAVELFKLLEKNLRVYDIQNFTFVSDSSGVASNKLNLNIKFYTYYLKNKLP